MTGSVLALDLGAELGWAMRSPAGVISSGVVRFRTGGRHGYGVRFLEFRRWLTGYKGGGIERVFYEDVRRHLSCDSAHAYGGFLAILAAWCEQHEVPYRAIGVGVWKKRIVGAGNADKEQVLAAMRARGYKPADYNEADALALLEYALRDPRGDPPARPARKPGRRAPAPDRTSELALADDNVPF